MRSHRLVSVLVVIAFQFFLLYAKGQDITADKVTVSLNDESLGTAIRAIEQQSAFRFFYRDEDVKSVTHLNLAPATRTVEQTLILLLQNTCLSFKQINNHILLERKEPLTACNIKGKVVSTFSNQPVAGASIFLSNATIGATTAEDGTYLLKNVKPGKYELVISNVGYDTYSQLVVADNKEVVVPPIVISPKTVMLTEVKVNSRVDPDFDKNYTLFKNEFLGTSKLAGECKILNPELLDLNYNYSANILTASSEDFLEIENYALGYKIKYLLTNFIKNIGNSNLNDVQFGGPALFQEMRGSTSQQKRWQKQRTAAYEGSLMHFLRCLLNNSYEEAGFRVLRIAHLPNPRRPQDTLINRKITFYKNVKHKTRADKDSLAYWTGKQLLPLTIDKLLPDPLKQDDMVKLTNQKGVFALAGDKCSLYIVYSKTHHYPSRIRTDNLNEAGNDNRTLVSFDAPYVLFDKNGWLMDPNCVSFDGAWGRDRIANLLPVDYDPAWTAIETENAAPNTIMPSSAPSVGQQDLKPELIKLKNYADSAGVNNSSEKTYLQLDKPRYLLGDTIWFKGYLVNAASLAASQRSGIMYVDIANDSSRLVKTYSFPVAGGITWGNIGLDERTFPAGNYSLRAYTNWMRNFGDDFFFKKSFSIAGTAGDDWLTNQQVTAVNATAKIRLQFSDLSKSPLANIPVNIRVFDGNKRLFKQAIKTDKDGAANFSIPVSEKVSDLKVVAQDDKSKKKFIIPIPLNRYSNSDVQFLPEGGSLVAGLPAHVGVKALGEDGRGVDVSATIFDPDKNPVAEFKSLHNGMGSFNMLVESEGTYTAKVNLPDGTVKEFKLPAVKSSGTILLVKNLAGSDSLDLSVGATNDIARLHQKYYLIARARGVVCYAAMIGFEKDKFIRGGIPKMLFPTGMVYITLMTTDRRPLNERTIFVDRHDPINVAVLTEKTHYSPHDSIALKIKVSDSQGNPLKGNFSMAVTDDGLVGPRSLNDDDIITHLQLTSAIKGYIQEPGYYFSLKNSNRFAALDNLLLTQGWVGYDWAQVFNPPVKTFPAETEFTVSGRVITAFNKPSKGVRVTLFSKSPLMLIDTVADKEGKFIFDGFPRVDTPVFVIKAVNKNGKSFNTVIEITDMKPPAFLASYISEQTQWNVNSDSTLWRYIEVGRRRQENEYLQGGGQMLKEVKITGQKTVKGSRNNHGQPDIVLDENDVEAAGKQTLLELLEEHVRSFHQGYFPQTPIQWYFIIDKPVYIRVDGVWLSKIFLNMSFTDMKYYLQAHSAEDIKGLEVMYTSDYNIAYVEITTRAGQGPIIDNTPNMYLYKPLALSWPKQFYKPKYTAMDTAKNRNPDFRATIDWEPNVNTDDNGEATISFFAGDRPTTYTYIIEGTDMSGNFGSLRGQIVINDEKKNSCRCQ